MTEDKVFQNKRFEECNYLRNSSSLLQLFKLFMKIPSNNSWLKSELTTKGTINRFEYDFELFLRFSLCLSHSHSCLRACDVL